MAEGLDERDERVEQVSAIELWRSPPVSVVSRSREVLSATAGSSVRPTPS